MDPAHLHLIITHLPIFGCFMGVVVQLYGLWVKSKATVNAAYIVFIISSAGGTVAYLTGAPAEELVGHMIGITEQHIQAHEQSAEITIVALAFLGLLSIMALIFQRVNKYSKELTSFILLVAVMCFVLASRTGYLGGKIRHLEIGFSNQHLNAKLSGTRQSKQLFADFVEA